jgi:hypothetical protein
VLEAVSISEGRAAPSASWGGGIRKIAVQFAEIPVKRLNQLRYRVG